MRIRMMVVPSVALALAGCAAPPPYRLPPEPVFMGPFNGEPWVSTQAPAGGYVSSGRNQPFQTPNSLPLGAWNLPGS